MEDTTISIIGIFVGAIIMFIVPLILVSDRSDDIAQLTAQTATTNFVDEVIKSGKITKNDNNDFVSMLTTTGNTYDIDIELKILDTNSSKLNTIKNYTTSGEIGQNTYYSIFTSQIEEKLAANYDEDAYDLGAVILKEGDSFSVTVKNKSLTLSQSLKNVYYNIKGENLHVIAATASGTVAINGST